MLPGVFTGARRILLLRLVANGIGQFALAFATAWFTQRAFDQMLQQSIVSTELWLWGTGLIACAIAFTWLRARERIDAERAGQTYATDLRVRLFHRLEALPADALEGKRRGTLVVRFVGDLKSLRLWVSLGLARVMVASICTAGGLIALATMHVTSAIVAALTIGLGAVSIFVAGKFANDKIRDARRQHARLTANISEKLGALKTVQINGQMSREVERVHLQSERVANSSVAQSGILAWLRAIADATGAMTAAAVLIVGVWMVAQQQASASMIVAAMTLVGLMATGLRDLGLVYGYWAKAQISKQKIIELLQWPNLESGNAPPLVVTRGSVEFRNATLAGRLHAVSHRIVGGQRIALVGASGAGKSALLALIARAIDVDDGAVLIDGQDVREVRLSSLRAEIGMVSAQLPLLRGTIAMNVRYRKPEASEEELAIAIDTAGLHTLLDQLPRGLATKLCEGGGNAPAHLRARITLARALLGNPRLLLIDDVETLFGGDHAEAVVRELTRDYPGTIIYAVRDAALARFADRAWLLNHGELVVETPAHVDAPAKDHVLREVPRSGHVVMDLNESRRAQS